MSPCGESTSVADRVIVSIATSSSVVKSWSIAIGASLSGVTVNVTVAGMLLALPSCTINLNVSLTTTSELLLYLTTFPVNVCGIFPIGVPFSISLAVFSSVII